MLQIAYLTTVLKSSKVSQFLRGHTDSIKAMKQTGIPQAYQAYMESFTQPFTISDNAFTG